MSRLRATDLVVLAAILAAVLARPLAVPPIALRGEAREGLVVRDIVREGRWILPRRNGDLSSKPPLYHWVAAAAAHAAGVSAVTVRLPSALGAWATAAATLALGVATAGRAAGWLGTGALLGTPMFWQMACRARVDMVFTAWVTIALAAFFLWYRDGGAGARAVCWLATAAAVLTKGPAGAVLVGGVIVLFLLVERAPRRLAAFWSWRLAAAALALVATWYALAYVEGGRPFLDRQIGFENVDRLLGRGRFEGVRAKRLFQLQLGFVAHLFPWNLCLVAAALRWRRGGREDASGRFLHVWWCTVLAAFTVAADQRTIYLLPLFPAVALLAGRELARAARAPGRPSLALVAAGMIALDLAVAGAALAVRERTQNTQAILPFARRVGQLVERDVPLWAAPTLKLTNLMVVAWTLDRPVPRRRPVCPGPPAYYLVPATLVERKLARGPYDLLAAVHEHGHDIALLRCRGPA